MDYDLRVDSFFPDDLVDCLKELIRPRYSPLGLALSSAQSNSIRASCTAANGSAVRLPWGMPSTRLPPWRPRERVSQVFWFCSAARGWIFASRPSKRV